MRERSGTRLLLHLFWPLAASSLLMATAEALVSAAMARVPHPVVALAAYGAVLAVSLLIEAPIIPVLHAANALVHDRASYRLVFAFQLSVAAACTALHALVALTPLFGQVFGVWLGLPASVVAAARPAMIAMLPWTPAISWRRFFQGVLIRRGVTRPVGAGTVVRTSVVALVLAAGLLSMPSAGVAVGGAALGLGVSCEAAFITLAARALARRSGLPLWHAETHPAPIRLRALVRFYVPLAMTAGTFILGRAVASAELARGLLAVPSLAAWPVATATLFLIQGPVLMTQQLVIAGPAGVGLRDLRRFTLSVGAAATLLLGVTLLGPLGAYYHYAVGVRGSVLGLSLAATAILGLTPLAAAQQQFWQGMLVRARATWGVIAGSGTNMVVLALAGLVGVTHLPWPGVDVVAAATALGLGAELCVLAVANRALAAAPARAGAAVQA